MEIEETAYNLKDNYMKEINVKFRVPIYNDYIWLFVGSSESLINNCNTKHTKFLKPHLEDYDTDSYAAALHEAGKNHITLLHLHEFPETTYAIGVLQHEIFHLTVKILTSSDILLSKETEEAYAYLNGYLTEKIYNILQKVR